MSTLPADMIVEILSRLPVKSLLRFRCVSKPWCSLIDSPNFMKLHLNQSIQHNTNLSLIFRSFYLCSVDFDTLDNPVELNDHPLKSTDFDFNTKVLSSCNGLLCLYSRDNSISLWNRSRKHCLFDRNYTISLWNPSTRKHQMIPFMPISLPPDIITSFFRFGFGYDSVNDDYKLVRIVHCDGCKFDTYYSDVSVYNLKTNSWRRIQDCPYYLHAKPEYDVHVNGALHWVMTQKRESETKNIDYLVVAFDLVFEEFVEVPQPEYLDKSFDMNLGVLGGCLCILCNYNRVLIDIWVMKEYGVKESWTKLFSVSEQGIGRRFENLRPLAYSKDGKEVLLEQDRRKIIWYDLENKSVRNAVIRGIRNYMEANICLGSLVLLNGGSGIDGKKKEAGEKKEENNKKRKSIGLSV